MRQTSLLLTGTLSFLLTTTGTAQSILQTYFKGNKDSMRAEATKLVNMPAPTFQSPGASAHTARLTAFKVYKLRVRRFITRDKQTLAAYRLTHKSPSTIVLLHGVNSNGQESLKTADLLRKATQAEVYAVDLRGHGRAAGKPGDVAYVNQYA